MDSLSYNYNAATNQLNHVRDNVPDNDYPSTGYIDIDNQSADNYTYDEIGNLIKDNAEGVTSIEWNACPEAKQFGVYGKITKQSFSTTTVGETKNVYYYYDATGNRMGKRNEKVAASGTTNDYLWYVRDASGNVMATYNSNPSTNNTIPNTLTVKERHLFGSSRLGMYTLKKDVKATPPSYTQTTPYNRSWLRGYKSYELSNHLGNVLSTITDIKFGVDTNSDGVIDYYTADVAGAQDYYPFGATQPGRSNGVSYRYGFNGKEKDKEGMTQYDYGFRIYDPRLGRFKSVDPLTKSFPWYSPYQFAGNMPIAAIDLDGEEQKIMINWYDVNGNITKTKIVKGDFQTVNNLYKSLSQGLNPQVKYTLEGTKFNSTNANFTEGFQSYKKGKGNPRNPYAPNIRPNNGTLNFDIYNYGKDASFVNISFDNAPLNEKELFADALRGASKVTNVVGTIVEGAGYLTLQAEVVGVGKAISSIGDVADLGADLLEGKTNDALLRSGNIIINQATNQGIMKIPMKKIGMEAIDTYIDRGTSAITDGVIENRNNPVEVSDKLDLKIETTEK